MVPGPSCLPGIGHGLSHRKAGQARRSDGSGVPSETGQGSIDPVSMKRWCQDSASPGSEGD